MTREMNSSTLRRLLVPVLLLVIAAVALKAVYLQTAESSFNAEELPLSALTLAGDTRAQANIATTRLYGTAPITTTLSLEAFGFTPLGLKLPNIVFFFLSMIFLALLARRLPELKVGMLWLLPSTLLVLGPPVVQIWGMKNRGGFIETFFALILCLWICARREAFPLRSIDKLAVAIIVGLAVWSQPIAIIWGAALFAYVLWMDASFSPKALPASIGLLVAGFLVGVLPLINMNYLFNFNTFAVISHGEVVEGIDLGWQGRVRELLVGGMPRLLGLKEQWSNDWVIWAPAARALYVLFLAPAIWAAVRLVVEFLRSRKVTVGLLVLGVALIVIAANIISSWGNFQLEPRRLLLLYVPFAILTSLGLLQTRKLLFPYLIVWIAFSAWANYVYIGKHRYGFSHQGYLHLDEVATYLISNRITGVYTDVWTGGRVTFASKGRIPWYTSEYEPSLHGYVGDDDLEPREAMLFNLSAPSGASGYAAFAGDAKHAGIRCVETTLQNIAILHHCSQRVELSELGMEAIRRQTKSGQVVLAMKAGDGDVKTLVGAKRDGKLAAVGKEGFLMFGPYKALPPGKFVVELDGTSHTPFSFDVAGQQGERVYAQVEMATGLDIDNRKLARLELEIDHSVKDVEVRIRVPANSDIQVDGYRILAR